MANRDRGSVEGDRATLARLLSSPMTREEMCDALGVSQRTITKRIGELESEGHRIVRVGTGYPVRYQILEFD